MMFAVVAVLLIAFVLFAVRSCGDDDKSAEPAEPKATPTVEASPTPRNQSTAYIVKRIKPRLDKISGLDTKVTCPKTVKLVAKEKITCDVFRTPDGKGDPIALVTVTMRDKTGYFTWESESTGS